MPKKSKETENLSSSDDEAPELNKSSESSADEGPDQKWVPS